MWVLRILTSSGRCVWWKETIDAFAVFSPTVLLVFSASVYSETLGWYDMMITYIQLDLHAHINGMNPFWNNKRAGKEIQSSECLLLVSFFSFLLQTYTAHTHARTHTRTHTHKRAQCVPHLFVFVWVIPSMQVQLPALQTAPAKHMLGCFLQSPCFGISTHQRTTIFDDCHDRNVGRQKGQLTLIRLTFNPFAARMSLENDQSECKIRNP